MSLFTKIRKELAAYERRRETVIKESRAHLREAKALIFLCHEGKVTEASERLAKLGRAFAAAEKKLFAPLLPGHKPFALYHEGTWAAAVEEYLEAFFFLKFLTTRKLATVSGIHPSADVYVGALSDTTGEVVRAAVLRGADKDIRTLERYRSFVASIVAFMLPLYLTGQSRQKFDQAKKNLKRIEEILYEVKIRS